MCVKEEFKHRGYKVEIIEDPELLLNTANISLEKVDELNLDTRILTGMYGVVAGKQQSYQIVVYNYKEFSSDKELMDAIVYHELGHILYPVGNEDEIEQELKCDRYSAENNSVESAYRMLCMAYQEVKKLGLNRTTAFLYTRKVVMKSVLRKGGGKYDKQYFQ